MERVWRRVVTKSANLSHAHKCAMRKKSETGRPEEEVEWLLDSYSKLQKVAAEKKKTMLSMLLVKKTSSNQLKF